MNATLKMETFSTAFQHTHKIKFSGMHVFFLHNEMSWLFFGCFVMAAIIRCKFRQIFRTWTEYGRFNDCVCVSVSKGLFLEILIFFFFTIKRRYNLFGYRFCSQINRSNYYVATVWNYVFIARLELMILISAPYCIKSFNSSVCNQRSIFIHGEWGGVLLLSNQKQLQFNKTGSE